jgi:hypothetical protein
MHCFQHPAEVALGVCKSCGKGVCRACAIEVDRGLACSETCRPFSDALSKLQATSIRNTGLITAQRWIQPALAGLFLGVGAFLRYKYPSDGSSWFLIAFGAIFLATTIMTLTRTAKSPRR